MATEKTTGTFKRVQILGDTAIVTSKLKFDAILKLQKRNSNALCLATRNEDGELVEVFRVEAQPTGTLSDYGVTFTCANKNGFAQTTVKIPCFAKDKKEYFIEEYGTALCMLAQIEEKAQDAQDAIEEMYKKLENEIVEVE